MLDYELAALSDPAKDQYFLTNPAKIQLILDAAGIRETDRVVEIGAGAGTIARALPQCASLTLIELDKRLIPALQSNAPDYAVVLNTDGIQLLSTGEIEADVILGNLPNSVTAELLALLPGLDFRVAVVATGANLQLEHVSTCLQYSILDSIGNGDFTPPQPGTSYLVSLCRRR